jgi:hypothetical protein
MCNLPHQSTLTNLTQWMKVFGNNMYLNCFLNTGWSWEDWWFRHWVKLHSWTLKTKQSTSYECAVGSFAVCTNNVYFKPLSFKWPQRYILVKTSGLRNSLIASYRIYWDDALISKWIIAFNPFLKNHGPVIPQVDTANQTVALAKCKGNWCGLCVS